MTMQLPTATSLKQHAFSFRAECSTMNGRLLYVLISAYLANMVGCDNAPSAAVGGTSGTLKFEDQVTSDIVITIHRLNGTSVESIGFGTTQIDGSFALYKPGAAEPLFLEPGEYSCTLESVGPSIKLPKDYMTASRSPLKFTWTSEMKSVELIAPKKLLAP